MPEDLQKAKFDQMTHNYETSSNGFKTHFIKNTESENNIFAAVNYVKSLNFYLKPEAVVTEIEKILKDVKSDDVYSELLIQQSDFLLRSQQPEESLHKLEDAVKYSSEKSNMNRISFQKACIFIHHLNDYDSGMDLLEKIIINSDKNSPIYELAIEELNSIKYDSENLSKKYISNESIINGFEVLGNFPNPFNPKTEIHFNLPSQSNITINIFSILGQHIKTIKLSTAAPGLNKVIWDSTNENGISASSGVYIYTINVLSLDDNKNYNAVSKMLLIR